MKTVVALAMLLSVAFSAPVKQDPDLKPLVRVKRADEQIIFGNHQNSPRVKKAGPVFEHEETVVEHAPAAVAEHPAQETQVVPEEIVKQTRVEDLVQAPSGPEVDDKLVEEEEVDDVHNGENGAVEEEEEQEEEKDEEKTVKVNSQNIDKSENEEENDLLSLGQQKAHEQEQGEQTEEEKEEEAESGDGAERPAEEAVYRRPDYNRMYDYYYDIPKASRQKRNLEVEQNAGLTAEGMGSAPQARSSPQRVKRALTADDIRDWLENGGESGTYEPTDYHDYGGDYYDDVVGDDGGWSREELEELLEDGAPWKYALEEELEAEQQQQQQQQQQQEEESPLPMGSEMYPYAADDQQVDETKNRMEMLRYLIKANPQSLLSEVDPEVVDESWEDMGPAAVQQEEEEEAQYEPIVYDGQAGIFFPFQQTVHKRQYMTMVPGMKHKRDFYPYAEEPQGGRWDAFVPPRSQDKRDLQDYDRLLRLAEALRGPEPYEEYEEDSWQRK